MYLNECCLQKNMAPKLSFWLIYSQGSFEIDIKYEWGDHHHCVSRDKAKINTGQRPQNR